MHSVRCELLLPMWRGLSVRLYLLVTTASCAKTDEPIEMRFDMWTRGAQRTMWGPGSPARRSAFGVHAKGRGQSIVFGGGA